MLAVLFCERAVKLVVARMELYTVILCQRVLDDFECIIASIAMMHTK